MIRVWGRVPVCKGLPEPLAPGITLHTFVSFGTRIMRRKTQEEFLQEVKLRNPSIEVLGIYKSNKDPILVRCINCGREWSPLAGSLTSGHGCPACKGSGQMTEVDFLWKLADKRDDVVLVGNFEKVLKKTAFKFMNCGHVYEITPSKILQGRGCPVCSNERRGASQRYTLEDFKEAMERVDPNLRLAEGAEYKNELTPVKIHCVSCGNDYAIGLKALKLSNGCPFCHRRQTSFMEQFIYHSFVHVFGEDGVLTRDRDAIGMELDILVPSKGIAVEPGSWYFHSGHVDRDREKKDACASKGIRLVTIYDHFHEKEAPFDDCLIFPINLSERKYRKLAKDTVMELFSRFGIDKTLSSEDWEVIEKAAWKDSRRMTTEEFKAELAEINPDIEFIDEYTFANDKKLFRCKKDGHVWMAQPTSIRMGAGCPLCAGTLKKSDEAFRRELQEKNPGITPLSPYENIGTAIKFKCEKCGHVWKTQPYHLLAEKNRTGCPRCHNRGRRTHEEFVAELAGILPRIRVLGHFESRHKRITVQCLDCGRIWEPEAGNLLSGEGCRVCGFERVGKAHSKPIRCVTTGEVFPSVRAAAKQYGVSPSAIVACLKGKSKHAAGQCWEYNTQDAEE